MESEDSSSSSSLLSSPIVNSRALYKMESENSSPRLNSSPVPNSQTPDSVTILEILEPLSSCTRSSPRNPNGAMYEGNNSRNLTNESPIPSRSKHSRKAKPLYSLEEVEPLYLSSEKLQKGSPKLQSTLNGWLSKESPDSKPKSSKKPKKSKLSKTKNSTHHNAENKIVSKPRKKTLKEVSKSDNLKIISSSKKVPESSANDKSSVSKTDMKALFGSESSNDAIPSQNTSIEVPDIYDFESSDNATSVPRQRKRNFKLAMRKNLKKNQEMEEQDRRIERAEKQLSKLQEAEERAAKSAAKSIVPDSPKLAELTNELTAPGLPILDCNRYLCYMSSGEDVFETEKETFDMVNTRRKTKITKDNFSNLVTSGYFYKSKMYLQSEMLDLLFKFMMVNKDELVALECQNTLEKLINRLGNRWMPSVTSIATVLLNLGVVLDATCPRASILRQVRPNLSAYRSSPIKRGSRFSKTHDCLDADNHLQVVGCTKLCHMIDTLILCCNHGRNNFKTEEIPDLIMILYWVALDSKIINHPVIKKIQNLCEKLLDWVDKGSWLSTMNTISDQLFRRIIDHQNVVYIIKNFPNSERGTQLKAVTSFSALCSLLDLQQPIPKEEILPREVFEIIKSQFPFTGDDISFTNSFVSLVTMSLVRLPPFAPSESKVAMESVSNYLLILYHKMKDISSEAAKVRDFILMSRFEITIKMQGKDPLMEATYVQLMQKDDMDDTSQDTFLN